MVFFIEYNMKKLAISTDDYYVILHLPLEHQPF